MSVSSVSSIYDSSGISLGIEIKGDYLGMKVAAGKGVLVMEVVISNEDA